MEGENKGIPRCSVTVGQERRRDDYTGHIMETTEEIISEEEA